MQEQGSTGQNISNNLPLPLQIDNKDNQMQNNNIQFNSFNQIPQMNPNLNIPNINEFSLVGNQSQGSDKLNNIQIQNEILNFTQQNNILNFINNNIFYNNNNDTLLNNNNNNYYIAGNSNKNTKPYFTKKSKLLQSYSLKEINEYIQKDIFQLEKFLPNYKQYITNNNIESINICLKYIEYTNFFFNHTVTNKVNDLLQKIIYSDIYGDNNYENVNDKNSQIKSIIKEIKELYKKLIPFDLRKSYLHDFYEKNSDKKLYNLFKNDLNIYQNDKTKIYYLSEIFDIVKQKLDFKGKEELNRYFNNFKNQNSINNNFYDSILGGNNDKNGGNYSNNYNNSYNNTHKYRKYSYQSPINQNKKNNTYYNSYENNNNYDNTNGSNHHQANNNYSAHNNYMTDDNDNLGYKKSYENNNYFHHNHNLQYQKNNNYKNSYSTRHYHNNNNNKNNNIRNKGNRKNSAYTGVLVEIDSTPKKQDDNNDSKVNINENQKDNENDNQKRSDIEEDKINGKDNNNNEEITTNINTITIDDNTNNINNEDTQNIVDNNKNNNNNDVNYDDNQIDLENNLNINNENSKKENINLNEDEQLCKSEDNSDVKDDNILSDFNSINPFQETVLSSDENSVKDEQNILNKNININSDNELININDNDNKDNNIEKEENSLILNIINNSQNNNIINSALYDNDNNNIKDEENNININEYKYENHIEENNINLNECKSDNQNEDDKNMDIGNLLEIKDEDIDNKDKIEVKSTDQIPKVNLISKNNNIIKEINDINLNESNSNSCKNLKNKSIINLNNKKINSNNNNNLYNNNNNNNNYNNNNNLLFNNLTNEQLQLLKLMVLQNSNNNNNMLMNLYNFQNQTSPQNPNNNNNINYINNTKNRSINKNNNNNNTLTNNNNMNNFNNILNSLNWLNNNNLNPFNLNYFYQTNNFQSYSSIFSNYWSDENNLLSSLKKNNSYNNKNSYQNKISYINHKSEFLLNEYKQIKNFEKENPSAIEENLKLFEEKIILPVYTKISEENQEKKDYYTAIYNKYKNLIMKILSKHSLEDISVEPYGSIVNNFMTEWGDIDICIVPKDLINFNDFWEYLNEIKEEAVDIQKIAKFNIIDKYPRFFLLKLIDVEKNTDLDITVQNRLPIENTKLIRLYSLLDQRFHILGIFLKFWVKKNHINGAPDKFLSSYALLILIIHYLQNIADPKILPILQEIQNIQKEYKYYYEDKELKTNLYFEEDLEKINNYMNIINDKNENNNSVVELLIGFLHFYSYEYNHYLISISHSAKKSVDKDDLVAFPLEDPFDINYNPGKSLKLKTLQYSAFLFCMKKELNNILSGEYFKFGVGE